MCRMLRRISSAQRPVVDPEDLRDLQPGERERPRTQEELAALAVEHDEPERHRRQPAALPQLAHRRVETLAAQLRVEVFEPGSSSSSLDRHGHSGASLSFRAPMPTPITVRGDVDDRAVDQLQRCADAGDAVRGALCADGHVGYSQPIGGVVAYPDHISPSGVGYDIACGNKAVRTNLRADDVRGGPRAGSWTRSSSASPSASGARTTSRSTIRCSTRSRGRTSRRSASCDDLAAKQLGTVGRRQPLRRPVRGRGRLRVGRRALRLARVRAQDRERVPRARAGAGVRRARARGRDGQPADAASAPTPSSGRRTSRRWTLAGEYAYAGRDVVVDEGARDPRRASRPTRSTTTTTSPGASGTSAPTSG